MPLNDLAARLDDLPSDESYGETEVMLTRKTLIKHLDDVVHRRRAAGRLQIWARLILSCDEVVYEDNSPKIGEIVFSIAHPGTRETLPNNLISQWIAELEKEYVEKIQQT